MMPEPRPEIIKPKDVFRDTSPAYKAKRRRSYARLLGDCARFALGLAPVSPPKRPAPFAPHDLAPRFFGMNVCPSPQPEGDGIILDALRELGVGAVRMDYAERADRVPARRLLEKLLAGGHAVTLHLVQDAQDASEMADAGRAADAWRAFVRDILAEYGDALEAIEVGSTPNRHSWSGYTLFDYAAAAAMAREEREAWARGGRGGDAAPLLLGPNISDFAPYFTIGQLAECYRRGVRFDAMTDNLFIDRVGEPEAWDPHVLGQRLKGWARMDLARKQRILSAIARRYGSERTWCTYSHYTLNFGIERRRYVSVEQYADYMVRQHLVTAAAGAFERLYWGTLVSHHKGLIDEGLGVRPYPPFVHHRFAINAPPDKWRRREPFIRSYATMTEWLTGARLVRRFEPSPVATVLEFEKEGRRIGVGWTRDGQEYEADWTTLGTGGFLPARMASREGRALDPADRQVLTSSPVYWSLQ